MTALLTALSALLASAVETVEAVTIVLAVGVTRGWRPALSGAGAALLALAALVAAIGPTVARVPIDDVRLVIGLLLLWFGGQWLRKAILRASGRKQLRDENVAFARDVEEARRAHRSAVVISFKGVFLEGLEVAIIVLTLGAAHGSLGAAIAGAALAVLLVTGVALVVRRPLARVPENTLALVVGVMLVSFGIFWTVEGSRLEWPGGDAMLPVLVTAVGLLSLASVYRMRRAPT